LLLLRFFCRREKLTDGSSGAWPIAFWHAVVYDDKPEHLLMLLVGRQAVLDGLNRLITIQLDLTFVAQLVE